MRTSQPGCWLRACSWPSAHWLESDQSMGRRLLVPIRALLLHKVEAGSSALTLVSPTAACHTAWSSPKARQALNRNAPSWGGAFARPLNLYSNLNGCRVRACGGKHSASYAALHTCMCCKSPATRRLMWTSITGAQLQGLVCNADPVRNQPAMGRYGRTGMLAVGRSGAGKDMPHGGRGPLQMNHMPKGL